MANVINTTFNNSDDLTDLPISVQDTLNDIIQQEGYKKPKIEKRLIPQNGNFLSFLYEVDIIGETPNGVKVTSLFIKKSVTLDQIVLAKVSDLYTRELFIYDDLFRTFAILQESANVPHEERFTTLKMYYSDNESIVMENLSKKGFRTYKNTQVISLRFVELSIVELAKFHALSYVTRKRIPKYFEAKVKILKSPFNLDSDWEGFVHNLCAVTAQVLNGEARDKIMNYAQRMTQTYVNFVIESVPSNGCLCHGDYKFLNIMVKEEDGEVEAVHPIDYQLVYYGNPVNDFLFFIFSGTDREFRKKHLSHMKDLYFDSFAKFLSYFNIDVDATYSRKEFDADYEERLELGLVYGLHLAAFTFADIEDGFDVTKLSLSELPIVPNEMFTDRVRGIVQDYIDWGYL